MLPDEPDVPPLADRLVVVGALAFLVGAAAATYLYTIDPYEMSFALFLLKPSISWPFYLGALGLASMGTGALMVRFG